MSVTFEGVTRRFDGVDVIHDLHLEVPDGSFTVVTGPPKSGKSVLFRTLVGLETADAGRILINGEDIAEQKAPERRVGYVPQSFALYPHMSVARNIGYPMALARAPKGDIAERVDWAAAMLAISHLLDKTPDQLSGGEKQRVAVARGLLKEADVFVFDDPLVGLDYKLRERLMDDLRELREELGKTFLYGTADSVEAMTLATRLVVLDGGRIVQEGATEEVYDEPRHPRAMELVGFPRANLLRGRIDEGVLRAGPIELPVEETNAVRTGGRWRRRGRPRPDVERRCGVRRDGGHPPAPRRGGDRVPARGAAPGRGRGRRGVASRRVDRHGCRGASGGGSRQRDRRLRRGGGGRAADGGLRRRNARAARHRRPPDGAHGQGRRSPVPRARHAGEPRSAPLMADVRIESVTKRFGDFTAVADMNVTFAEGEVTCLLGPSGCGKTTLMRMVAGLESVTSGRILFGGRDVTRLPPRRRDIGMVFQYPVMYPTLSVEENILEPLRTDRSLDKAERRRRVDEMLEILDMTALAHHHIDELDAGLRQKVAVGRAVARHSDIVLFDEPTTNVEVNAKLQLIRAFKEVTGRLRQTIVYVTHDQTEAMTLADRIALMKDGRIVQLDAPRTLYDAPTSTFGGWFLGAPGMNFVPAEIDGRSLRSPVLGDARSLRDAVLEAAPGGDARGSVDTTGTSVAGGKNGSAATSVLAAGAPAASGTFLGIRPEYVELHAEAVPGGISGTLVDRTIGIGGRYLVRVDVGGTRVAAKIDSRPSVAAGETCHLSVPSEHLLLFRDGERLPLTVVS